MSSLCSIKTSTSNSKKRLPDIPYLAATAGDAIKRHTISELTLAEFRELSFLATVCSQKPTVLLRSFTRHADGPQSAATAMLKPWVCRQEDELPTLEEAFADLTDYAPIETLAGAEVDEVAPAEMGGDDDVA